MTEEAPTGPAVKAASERVSVFLESYKVARSATGGEHVLSKPHNHAGLLKSLDIAERLSTSLTSGDPQGMKYF